MKKYLVGLAVVAALVPSTPASAELPHNGCRFKFLDGRKGFSVHEVKRTIRCAARVWPVDLSTAFAIADRESGFHAKAVNPYSGTCGVYQHMPAYWPDRRNAYNRAVSSKMDVLDSCLNGRSNVLVSIRMAHKHGWGPWGG